MASGDIAPPIRNLSIRWSTSCTGRFTPGERASGTHWVGGWTGLSARLNAAKFGPKREKVKVRWRKLHK
jgi:hypothetical protein